jgi:hypothetical protein
MRIDDSKTLDGIEENIPLLISTVSKIYFFLLLFCVLFRLTRLSFSVEGKEGRKKETNKETKKQTNKETNKERKKERKEIIITSPA